MPLTFSNTRQAIAALESGVVLVDRSHWGRVRIAGETMSLPLSCWQPT